MALQHQQCCDALLEIHPVKLDQATPVLLEVPGILIWELFPTHGWGEPADEAPKDWKEMDPSLPPLCLFSFLGVWGDGDEGEAWPAVPP